MRSQRLSLIVLIFVGLVAAAFLVTVFSNPFPQKEGAGQITAQALTQIETSLLATGPTYEYRPGARFVYGFSIKNRGLLRVTLTSITKPEEALVRHEEALIADPSFDGDPEDSTPFRERSLRPNDEMFVLIRARLAGCDWLDRPVGNKLETIIPTTSGNVLVKEREEVRFRVLGIPRSEDISIPGPFGFIVTEEATARCNQTD